MIQVNQKLLPEQDRKEIQEWLNSHSARILQELIASKSAELSAEAANLLLQSLDRTVREVSLKEATDKAADAKIYCEMNKLLDSMRGDEYKFVLCELKPETVTK